LFASGLSGLGYTVSKTVFEEELSVDASEHPLPQKETPNGEKHDGETPNAEVPSAGLFERPLKEQLVRELLQTVKARAEESDDSLLARPAEAIALLRDAMRERATDIHLDSHPAGWLARLRVDGIVLDGTILPHDAGFRLLNQFKTMARLVPFDPFLPKEGRFTQTVDDQLIDLRLSYAPCLRGDKLNIRVLIPDSIPHELHDLGIAEEGLLSVQDWLDDISGMLLVAGPTGSGKTTTLYALLHRLKLRERSIITIEDPVEYEVPGINHMQVDEKHGLGFPEGVKAMLRLDPDYLMLGEIRDPVSAHAAVTAASGGRAIMSTVHSRDAVGVIDTMRNFGLAGHEISSNLMMVIAQRLVRKLCVHCRKKDVPTDRESRWLGMMKRKVPKKIWRARGCEQCRGLGYQGRTGVFEVWRINRDEYQLILDEADRRTLYRQLAQRGHEFLLDKAMKKVNEGVTTLEELRSMGGVSALPTIDRKGELQ
jgi:general secretion pathway protein E